MPFRRARSRHPECAARPRAGGASPRAVLFALLLLPTVLVGQSRSRAAIDAAVRAGISRHVFPGAVVVVGRADTILFSQGYGSYAWKGDSRRPDPAWSLWDVASISKVVATASAVAVLVDRSQLDLDTPVSRFVPAFQGGAKDSVTVRMLLDHTSGLPAWAPLGSDDSSRGAAWDRLFTIDLRRPPGEAAVYSDLNAILAGLVIERVTGKPLERFTSDAVFSPTGMRSAEWRPTAADKLRAVPTELERDGSMLLGTVQDPNARALGGVAGHAGVFATGIDLAHFAQKWLRGLREGDSSWVRPATMARFLERSESAGTRVLGWDTPILETGDGKPPLYGSCATETTFGHTGYTGTLLWLDPDADLFVVFLTNRSLDPARRSMSEIRDVRAAVSDAARRLAGGRC